MSSKYADSYVLSFQFTLTVNIFAVDLQRLPISAALVTGITDLVQSLSECVTPDTGNLCVMQSLHTCAVNFKSKEFGQCIFNRSSFLCTLVGAWSKPINSQGLHNVCHVVYFKRRRTCNRVFLARNKGMDVPG
jgi:hypothetical protein